MASSVAPRSISRAASSGMTPTSACACASATSIPRYRARVSASPKISPADRTLIFLPRRTAFPGSRAQVLHPVKDWINIVVLLAGEVHLRNEALHQPGREQGEMHVRRSHPVVVARVGIRTRLDGAEGIAPLRVCQRATPPLEVRVQRRLRRVVR